MTDLTSRLSTALGDRYQIERELGSGGMATVRLAEDFPALKRPSRRRASHGSSGAAGLGAALKLPRLVLKDGPLFGQEPSVLQDASRSLS